MSEDCLDCPRCGDGVSVLTWEAPSEAWPFGAWVGCDGDMATCETCGWLVMVSCDSEEPPYLVEVACPHKREPQAGCWRCDFVEWLSTARYWIRRWLREAWCGLRRLHDWHQVEGCASISCRRCGRFVYRKVTP